MKKTLRVWMHKDWKLGFGYRHFKGRVSVAIPFCYKTRNNANEDGAYHIKRVNITVEEL